MAVWREVIFSSKLGVKRLRTDQVGVSHNMYIT